MRSCVRTLICTLPALAAFASHARSGHSWVPGWSTANYRLEQDALLSGEQLADATLRQEVRLSVGGPRLRIVLTNTEGSGPLVVTAVHVALAGSPGTATEVRGSDHEVRIDGRPGVLIPPGEKVTSDAVEMPIPPLSRLLISMHFEAAPVQQTGHLRSLSTSWIAQGNQVGAPALTAATSIEHWYFLAAVEVEAPAARAIVTFGDSITDGSRSTLDGNARWPDRLAERIVAMPGNHGWGRGSPRSQRMDPLTRSLRRGARLGCAHVRSPRSPPAQSSL